MKVYYPYLLAFIICFYGCTNRPVSDLKFKHTQNVKCVSMPETDIIGIPLQLLQKDSLLIINDFRDDSLLYVYNIKSKQGEGRLIASGNGPNELINPIEVQFKDNNMLLFSRPIFSLYSSSNNINKSNMRIDKEFVVSSELSHVFSLTDSAYIASGILSKRYAMLDKNGGKVGEFGDYPSYWNEEKDIPVDARAMFHQCMFSQCPKCDRFIAYTSRILEIYDFSVKDTFPQLISRSLLSEYNYNYTIENILSTNAGDDVEFGIRDSYCSSQYIYLLFDPNTKSITSKNNSKIYIFDWDGNPIKSLNMSHILSNFVIDEQNKTGYCIIEDQNYELACFPL